MVIQKVHVEALEAKMYDKKFIDLPGLNDTVNSITKTPLMETRGGRNKDVDYNHPHYKLGYDHGYDQQPKKQIHTGK